MQDGARSAVSNYAFPIENLTVAVYFTTEDVLAQEPETVEAFRAELDRGYFAMVSTGEGHAEQVKELPIDAELVILRLPISGG